MRKFIRNDEIFEVDYVRYPCNLTFLGASTPRKTAYVTRALTDFLNAGRPVIAIDFQQADGTSSLSDYADLLAGRATYVDVGKVSNNIMQLPNMRRHYPLGGEYDKEYIYWYKEYLEFSIPALLTTHNLLVSFSDEERNQFRIESSIIRRALCVFFEDSSILERYTVAFNGGIDSLEWQTIPLLMDLAPFFAGYDENTSASVEAARKRILQQLEKFQISETLDIARPTSFSADADLLVFTIEESPSNAKFTSVALSAFAAAFRYALEARGSILFFNENPVLFDNIWVNKSLARIAGHGPLYGIRLFLSVEDIATVVESNKGEMICQNSKVLVEPDDYEMEENGGAEAAFLNEIIATTAAQSGKSKFQRLNERSEFMSFRCQKAHTKLKENIRAEAKAGVSGFVPSLPLFSFDFDRLPFFSRPAVTDISSAVFQEFVTHVQTLGFSCFIDRPGLTDWGHKNQRGYSVRKADLGIFDMYESDFVKYAGSPKSTQYEFFGVEWVLYILLPGSEVPLYSWSRNFRGAVAPFSHYLEMIKIVGLGIVAGSLVILGVNFLTNHEILGRLDISIVEVLGENRP